MPYDRTNPTEKPLAKELRMVNREYDEIIEDPEIDKGQTNKKNKKKNRGKQE